MSPKDAKVEEVNEKKMVKVLINGIEIEVPANSRVVTQLQNIREKQLEEEFATTRKEVSIQLKDAVQEVLEQLDENQTSALEGMTFVIVLDTNDEPQLVASNKVVVKKRVAKEDDEE